jgi:hypothetical protein
MKKSTIRQQTARATNDFLSILFFKKGKGE